MEAVIRAAGVAVRGGEVVNARGHLVGIRSSPSSFVRTKSKSPGLVAGALTAFSKNIPTR